MKKSILTIGLFSLVMVLTSFTTPETNNIVGGQGCCRRKYEIGYHRSKMLQVEI
jgi:hypothetical protein